MYMMLPPFLLLRHSEPGHDSGLSKWWTFVWQVFTFISFQALISFFFCLCEILPAFPLGILFSGRPFAFTAAQLYLPSAASLSVPMWSALYTFAPPFPDVFSCSTPFLQCMVWNPCDYFVQSDGLLNCQICRT